MFATLHHLFAVVVDAQVHEMELVTEHVLLHKHSELVKTTPLIHAYPTQKGG